jgi:pimeloyl-ACP methyl ester carboxylesterase
VPSSSVVPHIPAPAALAPRFREGKGTPLLLLHGLGMSWRAWQPLLPACTAHHDVLAPTLPGHRGATTWTGKFSIAALADAVEGEMTTAGFSTAHMVGNSLGGWVALELGRRGRARSLTAISPAGAWRTRRDHIRLNLAIGSSELLMRNPLVSTTLALSVRQPQGRRLAFSTLMERGDRMTVQQARDTIADFRACTVVGDVLRSGWRDGPFQALEEARYPIRLIWGRRDKVIPYRLYGAPYLDRLPSVTQIGLPGAGHVPMHDATDILSALILQLAAHQDLLQSGGTP